MEIIKKLVDIGKDSPVKTSAIVSISLATATLLYYSLFASRNNVGEELAPAVTEEEARTAMNLILEKLKLTAPKMLRAAENIKQQIAAQGQDIENEQLMKMFILPHFDQAFREIQDSTLDELNIDEDELEEAVDVYTKENDAELIEIVRQIKSVYKQFGGDVVDDEEPESESNQNMKDLSLEELLLLLNKLSSEMKVNTDKYAQKFVEDNGPPSNHKMVEQFHLGLLQLTEGIEKKIIEGEGLTTKSFQVILMQYQESPAVQQTFMSMQADNQQILMKHGIGMMM